jgi:hypothetical protein
MPVVVIDCPHCSAENTTFLFQHSYQVIENDQSKSCWMLFRCPRCLSGVVVKGTSKQLGIPPDEYEGDIHGLFFSVDHFPKRYPIEAPGGLPPDIKRLYLRTAQSLQRDDTDGASMLARKTLEITLKKKFGEFTGSLSQRIKSLNHEHLLTDDLAQWADEIRIDGNQGVHESAEPDRENTRQLKEFLHVFLLYTFSLPALVRERRKIAG